MNVSLPFSPPSPSSPTLFELRLTCSTIITDRFCSVGFKDIDLAFHTVVSLLCSSCPRCMVKIATGIHVVILSFTVSRFYIVDILVELHTPICFHVLATPPWPTCSRRSSFVFKNPKEQHIFPGDWGARVGLKKVPLGKWYFQVAIV